MNPLKFLQAILLAEIVSGAVWLPARAAEARHVEANRLSENAAVRIDGDLRDPAWQRAEVLRAISFPWSKRAAPATEFRAVGDAERLYFAFDVSDDDVVVQKDFAGESTLDREDRVEIFFARDPALECYFCLEIDPLGRVHDYVASYYRKFDSSWTCAGLQAAGRIRPGGYTVEVSIPLETLAELMRRPVAAGASLRLGIFRAEFRRGALGDADDNWLSWIKPVTDKPDFHVPSAFANWRVPGLLPAPADAFQTRGVVLVPEDLSLADWPERAAKAGLTTVGLHHGASPKAVVDFIESPAGRDFLAKCARLGVQVEYELHAMRELLPRALFATEPALFRMNDQGERTPDANLCVHSPRALEVVASNALRLARQLRPTTGRYFFWGDDGQPWCRCPQCREFSDSDQALLLNNHLMGALLKFDPRAQLAHLAYANTLAPPKRVKPEPGVFLEFAPIHRQYDLPIAQQTGPEARDVLKSLEENLRVFPADTAQALEYWLDVSRFSRWKRPAVKLPWRRDVVEADAQTYARLGLRHVTTFAVWIDADYVKRFGEPDAIQEYGQTLRQQAAVVLENAHVRYTVSSDGRNLGFVDRATGVDYLKPSGAVPCALVRRAGKEFPVTSAVMAGDRLMLKFAAAGIEVVLRVEPQPSYLRLRVEAVRGGEIDSLVFLNVPLTLRGRPDEPFGACAMSLNLITRVDQLPALQTELRAACEKKFGLVGARAAIVGMPMSRMLPALQEVLSEADEMPLCKVGGPWAREVPFNHGSYLFNFGSLVETNVADWIAMARSLGFTQIDNHGGGGFFRFGDFELNRAKWPDGWETWRRIVARLHDAGIGSIFHTYAFFIDKRSRYVTPVPDQRLDAFRSFTLAGDVSADATEIPVEESTAGLSTVTGFFEHNSVVLHLGNELITFGGFSKEPPWRFTGLNRGALGTKAVAHAKGTKARHLKECFGLFVPDPESSLFTEIAANHAEVVDRCGFDGIYLDAIDGSSILRGADECWYWADKFVFEIQKRLRKPVGMEMSAMWHHFWQYRTRWQAWDYPQRGHKRFIDLHAESINGGLLLPLHLGWWNFQSFNPPQIEPTYADAIEYLGAKLVGWDAGISLTGAVDRDKLQSVPLFRRAADILRTCEDLRHAGTFDEAAKAKLREPGREFALVTNATGKVRFRRLQSEAHSAALAEPWTLAWRTTNSFGAQPVRFRIEALMSAASPDDTNAIVLADFSGADAAKWSSSSAEGVSFTVSAARDGAGVAAGVLVATNSGLVARDAAWARLEKRFDPTLNLKDRQALGVLIEGDGLGEVLAIRLESPRHISFGAVADRYVTVDFTGRRFVTLVETESARWSDFVWNDGKSLYNVYRETIDFGAIESVSLWLQNLPPGQDTRCRLGSVKALPLLPATIKNPALTVNDERIELPSELISGSWIECNGADDCAVYGPRGETLVKVKLNAPLATLRAGSNELRFSCSSESRPAPRVKVTLFTLGEEL